MSGTTGNHATSGKRSGFAGRSGQEKVVVSAPSAGATLDVESGFKDGSESREVARARIREIMAVVDRWFDSDEYVP